MVTDELEITYDLSFEDIKKEGFDVAYHLISILIFGVLPVTCIIIFEIVMIVLGVKNGFGEFEVLLMITIPSATAFAYFLFPLFYYILMKIRWNEISKLPLEKRWLFTDEGILIDEIYRKNKYTWEQVTRAGNKMKSYIWLNVVGAFLHTLPKRVLDEEQLKQLYSILTAKLDSKKLKHFKVKQKV